MKASKTILYSLVVGLGLSVLSGFIVGTYQGQVGNLCEKTDENPGGWCYESLKQAGYPFAYLRDSGVNSAVGSFGPEDEFRAWAFVADWAIYSAIVVGLLTIRKKYKN